MITATAGLAMLIGVTVTSVVVARRRLSYETWYFIHLTRTSAIALAFSHQLATGSDFVGDGRRPRVLVRAVRGHARRGRRPSGSPGRSPAARATACGSTRVVEEGPGVVSVEIGGRRLDRLRAQTGQFFTWRFLTRDRWWEAHPFSLSAAPDGRRLRITVKGVGDFTASLRGVTPGTPVIVEGPFGVVHVGHAAPPAGGADRRRHRHHPDPRAARGHARRAG